MKKNNFFSLKRVFQLIGMEFRVRGQQILIISGIVLAGLVLLSLLSGFARSRDGLSLEQNTGLNFLAIMMIWVVSMFVYLMHYYSKMNKRIRSSGTIAYCSIPSSVEEKYVSILLIGVIHFIIAWVVAQLAVLILTLINPNALDGLTTTSFTDPNALDRLTTTSFTDEMFYIRRGLFFYNPVGFMIYELNAMAFLFISYVVYFMISSKKASGWNAVKWWEYIFVFAFTFVVLLPVTIEYDGVKKGLFLDEYLPVIYWSMAVAFFVGGYLRLRRIEQL